MGGKFNVAKVTLNDEKTFINFQTCLFKKTVKTMFPDAFGIITVPFAIIRFSVCPWLAYVALEGHSLLK